MLCRISCLSIVKRFRGVSIPLVVDHARSDSTVHANSFYGLVFQSLLWWIMLGRLSHSGTFGVLVTCFNPSYGGLCSVGYGFRKWHGPRIGVSIPLMVDYAR